MTDVSPALVLIQSEDGASRASGSGFVIFRTDEMQWVVTCAHVVCKPKTTEARAKIWVSSLEAKLVAASSQGDMDLAVLCVSSLRQPAVRLPQAINLQERRISVHGYFKKGEATLAKAMEGLITKRIRIYSRNHESYGWELTMDGRNELHHGYSGGIVLSDGEVIGIAFQKNADSLTGEAVCITALATIWPDLPVPLRNAIERLNPLDVQEKAENASHQVEALEARVYAAIPGRLTFGRIEAILRRLRAEGHHYHRAELLGDCDADRIRWLINDLFTPDPTPAKRHRILVIFEQCLFTIC